MGALLSLHNGTLAVMTEIPACSFYTRQKSQMRIIGIDQSMAKCFKEPAITS